VIGNLLDDRYSIEAELGRGGMGVVYRAHDTRLDREVALKVVSSGGLSTEGRSRLMNEAQAAARLNHPNIVAVYDAGEARLASGAMVPYVVMELLQGPTLHEKPPEDEEAAASVARQLCAALDHAHERGVIHRDVKPENVMMVGTGQTVKLMDFGLARSVASRLTGAGAVMGTLFYLSPEMIRGESVDGRADLYALGIMLYEWVTGRLPFEAADPVAVLSQHLYAPVVPPSTHRPGLQPGLEALILQLLAKDPDRRPANAAVVLATLESLSSRPEIAEPGQKPSLLDRIARGRLVGREDELAQSRAMWSRARSGQGQLLLISGEPGIGKSRLARELATLAVAGGGQALEGAAYAEGGLPYGPFRQILRQAFRSAQAHGQTLPAQKMPNLMALAPELIVDSAEVEPASKALADLEQGELLEEMVLLLSILSQHRPLLLLLEDMHWADSASLVALRHLTRYARHLPLLLVATYREVEIGQGGAFPRLLLDLNREQLGARIKLGRLDHQGTAALLGILFDEAITPDFLEGIYSETEGNPFFIEEVCKALIDSGKVAFREGRWHRPPVAELGVPQSIQVAIRARVQALPPEAQQLLELAAVLGRDFEVEILVRASEAPEETVIEALEEARAAQLVEEAGGRATESYSFAHALIPTSLVAGLRTLQRRRLHRQAAAALETVRPDAYEVLAHHFVEGAEMEKSVEYLIKAGDRARALYAHQEAIEAYEGALEYLREQGEPESMARLLMKLGQAYHSAFEFEQARLAHEEGFDQQRLAAAARSAAPLPRAPHPLRLAEVEPQTLDPGESLDNAVVAVADQLFSGLVEITQELDVVPDVAQRWQILDGGRRYRFHLRADALWSDGRPVTAGDFVFGLRRRLDRSSGSPEAPMLYDIKGAEAYHRGELARGGELGVRALDDTTLEVELEQPTAYFLQIAAYLRPLPRRTIEALGPAWTAPENIVTSGPFLLEEWRPGEVMRLRRNPQYPGRFPGNVEQVELRFRLGVEEAISAYGAGELDLLNIVRLGQAYSRLRRWYADDYTRMRVLGTYFLSFSWWRPPLDDVHVRQALVLALDREYLASVLLDGRTAPATGGFVPPGMAGHVPGIALPFDPDRARRLLAEAGYPGGRGLRAFGLSLPGPEMAHLAQGLEQQWRQHLGVNVTVESIPWATLLQQPYEARADMWAMAWTPYYPDPDDFLRLSSAGWHIQEGWGNQRIMGLLEEARRQSDHERRLALYEEIEKILVTEAPFLPLSYLQGHCLVKPWVRRTPYSPLKHWHFKDVILEPH
jgi:ABC-type oligopeptide transport system substrate-binding subunit